MSRFQRSLCGALSGSQSVRKNRTVVTMQSETPQAGPQERLILQQDFSGRGPG